MLPKFSRTKQQGGSKKYMSIILYLGHDVKEYNAKSEKSKIESEEGSEESETQSEIIINKLLEEGKLLCDICLEPLKRHSNYTRGIRETGETLEITYVFCKDCKHGHALLPDFILRYKQYSGNEIESVLIDSKNQAAKEIATKASESTIKRWIKGVGDSVKKAVSILKSIFMEFGKKISETQLDAGFCYDELEQMMDMAPETVTVKYSGNKLGWANLWLGRHNRRSYIC
jgi:hypothetical protein